MARELHYRERRMLRCIGMTARAVAAAEQMRVDEVLAIRTDLRARGLLPSLPSCEEPDPAGRQLTFGDDGPEVKDPA